MGNRQIWIASCLSTCKRREGATSETWISNSFTLLQNNACGVRFERNLHNTWFIFVRVRFNGASCEHCNKPFSCTRSGKFLYQPSFLESFWKRALSNSVSFFGIISPYKRMGDQISKDTEKCSVALTTKCTEINREFLFIFSSFISSCAC